MVVLVHLRKPPSQQWFDTSCCHLPKSHDHHVIKPFLGVGSGVGETLQTPPEQLYPSVQQTSVKYGGTLLPHCAPFGLQTLHC